MSMQAVEGQVIERSKPKAAAVEPSSESASILAIISRAASDPDTNIDKLERLMAMYERLNASKARAAYDAALAAMQPELPIVNERGGIKNNAGKVQSTYALWEDINEAIKPVLAKHGFALTFRTGQKDGKIVVTGVLGHKDGHREETTIELPHDSSGSKNAVQAVGSSNSYGKRYTASALLNLTSRGEDDDGKKAGGGEPVTDEQVRVISDLLTTTKSNLSLFLKKIKLESIAEIRADKFDEVVALIKDTAKKRAARDAETKQ